MLMKQGITLLERASINAVVPPRAFGFTLVETMVAVGLFLFVVAGSLGVYVMCEKYWHATLLDMQTAQMAGLALSKMVNGVGTNSGIRAAAAVAVYSYPTTVTNSAYLHSHLNPTTYQYWLYSSTSPPPATDPRLDMTCSYPTFNDGGSWRLMFSNQFSGVQYIEYNFPFQTLSLGTNSQRRLILATYVTNAVVAPDNQGINIAITVARRIGALTATNTASTYLRLRNNL